MALVCIETNQNTVNRLCNGRRFFQISARGDLKLEVGIINNKCRVELVEEADVVARGLDLFGMNSCALFTGAIEVVVGNGGEANGVYLAAAQLRSHLFKCLVKDLWITQAGGLIARSCNGVQVDNFGAAGFGNVAAILFGKLFNGLPGVAQNLKCGLKNLKHTAADHYVVLINNNGVGGVEVNTDVLFEKIVNTVSKTAVVAARNCQAILGGNDRVAVLYDLGVDHDRDVIAVIRERKVLFFEVPFELGSGKVFNSALATSDLKARNLFGGRCGNFGLCGGSYLGGSVLYLGGGGFGLFGFLRLVTSGKGASQHSNSQKEGEYSFHHTHFHKFLS